MKAKPIISLLLMLLVATAAGAQSASLKISRIFDGKVVTDDRMVVTKVKGPSLSKYGLCYYRSARFVATRKERDLCAEAVKQDLKTAGQGSTVQQRAGRRSSVIGMLRPQGGYNRFVSLVCTKESGGRYGVTLLYMEGTVGSISELNKKINK